MNLMYRATLIVCMPVLFAMLLFLAIFSPYRLGRAMEKTGRNLIDHFGKE